MTLPTRLSELRLPIVSAPMFLVSGIDLVVEQCRGGVVGSFPARNARSTPELVDWLETISERVEGHASSTFAVNLISHSSNSRFEADAEACIAKQTPMIITSMAPPGDLVAEVKSYGGLVFHDVTTVRHAEKALEQGVDGLVLVCAGAGGHAGTLNPFAFVAEVRRFFSGPLVVGGGITSGSGVLAVQAMGADLAYMGTRFIATSESLASDDYKRMVTESTAADVTYTPYFSGIPANYLSKSIAAAGLSDEAASHIGEKNYKGRDAVKAWRDIWGSGQGVGNVATVSSTADVIETLEREYISSLQSLKTIGGHRS